MTNPLLTSPTYEDFITRGEEDKVPEEGGDGDNVPSPREVGEQEVPYGGDEDEVQMKLQKTRFHTSVVISRVPMKALLTRSQLVVHFLSRNSMPWLVPVVSNNQWLFSRLLL